MLIVVHVLFNMITAVTIHYTGHFTVYSLMLIVILYIFQEAPMSLPCEPCIGHSLNSYVTTHPLFPTKDNGLYHCCY